MGSIHMEPAYDVPSSAVPPSSHAASSNTFGFRMWYHPPFAQPEPPLEPLEHWESVPQNLYRDFLYASGGGNSLDYVTQVLRASSAMHTPAQWFLTCPPGRSSPHKGLWV